MMSLSNMRVFGRNYRKTFRLYSSNTNNIRDKHEILERSLTHVHQFGWTQEAIQRAVEELGLPTTAHTLIDRGVYDLVEHFTKKRREYVSDRVRQLMVDDSDKQLDRVRAALDAHASFVQPYLKSWPTALAIMVEPAQLMYTSSSLLRIADDICQLEDIKAFRIDWYSERVLALYLFASTEVYMLTDSSQDLADTRDFTARNVDFYRHLKTRPNIGQHLRESLMKIMKTLNL